MNIHYCYDCKHNVSFPTIPHTVNNGTMMHKLGKAVKDGETRELRKTHAKQAAGLLLLLSTAELKGGENI